MAQKEHAHVIHKIGIRAYIEEEITSHATPGIDTDPAVERLRHMAGLLHRLPAHLEELAMLWIENRRFLWTKSEEVGIEMIILVEHGRGGHIIFLTHERRVFACVLQILFAKRQDAFDTRRKVAPKAVDTIGTRHLQRHTDNRNIAAARRLGGIITHQMSVSRTQNGAKEASQFYLKFPIRPKGELLQR